jgi:hypothetical protein
MRVSASSLAIVAALAGCGGDDNQVTSGFPGVIISPVRSSISAVVTFHDPNGNTHRQSVIAMTDAANLCTKITTNPAYFQTASDNFNAIVFWIPPDRVGTGFIGQAFSDGTAVNTEVVLGSVSGGTPALAKFGGVTNGGTIVVNQFNTGPGGEAIGNFDVAVFDANGVPRELLGKFKAIYCTGMEQAQLP